MLLPAYQWTHNFSIFRLIKAHLFNSPLFDPNHMLLICQITCKQNRIMVSSELRGRGCSMNLTENMMEPMMEILNR